MLRPIKRLWCQFFGHKWDLFEMGQKPLSIDSMGQVSGRCTCCGRGRMWSLDVDLEWRVMGGGMVDSSQWFELTNAWNRHRPRVIDHRIDKEATDA